MGGGGLQGGSAIGGEKKKQVLFKPQTYTQTDKHPLSF